MASQTCEFVHLLGLRGRVEIVSEKSPDVLRQADIVTNSGHLRPLDAPTIRAMKPTAVIPLMYEAWELRPGDVDLDECRAYLERAHEVYEAIGDGAELARVDGELARIQAQ